MIVDLPRERLPQLENIAVAAEPSTGRDESRIRAASP